MQEGKQLSLAALCSNCLRCTPSQHACSAQDADKCIEASLGTGNGSADDSVPVAFILCTHMSKITG